ncbi:MAG: plastocyanin/azurin family copper-binding protein [Candidatus Saccharimonadales bacterium]
MKTAIIVIAVIVLAGGAGFVIMNNKDDNSTGANDASNQTAQQGESSGTPNTPEDQTNNDSSGNLDPNNYTQGANIGGTIDATDQSEATISIDDFVFETTFLKIKKGTKVTWINNGNVGHDVTSADSSRNGGLGSQLLGSGDSYEFTFEEAGIYEYFCTPHSTEMRGVITVVE